MFILPLISVFISKRAQLLLSRYSLFFSKPFKICRKIDLSHVDKPSYHSIYRGDIEACACKTRAKVILTVKLPVCEGEYLRFQLSFFIYISVSLALSHSVLSGALREARTAELRIKRSFTVITEGKYRKGAAERAKLLVLRHKLRQFLVRKLASAYRRADSRVRNFIHCKRRALATVRYTQDDVSAYTALLNVQNFCHKTPKISGADAGTPSSAPKDRPDQKRGIIFPRHQSP